MERTLTFRVENGLPKWVLAEIEELCQGMEGKRIALTLREQKVRRSGNQNRYYWGIVIPKVLEMFTEAGNNLDPETVHGFLKEHIGGLVTVILDPAGKRKSVVGSTTALSTAEFELYLEKVRAWAAEFGTQIPLPNEV